MSSVAIRNTLFETARSHRKPANPCVLFFSDLPPPFGTALALLGSNNRTNMDRPLSEQQPRSQKLQNQLASRADGLNMSEATYEKTRLQWEKSI